MAKKRQVRGDCRVGAFEEKNNLPPGTIRNKNGRNTCSDNVENGSVVIKSVGKIREGWAEAAAKCSADDSGRMEEWDCTVNDFDGEWL